MAAAPSAVAATPQWVNTVEVVASTTAADGSVEMRSLSTRSTAGGDAALLPGHVAGQSAAIVLSAPHSGEGAEAANHALIVGPVALFLRAQEANHGHLHAGGTTTHTAAAVGAVANRPHRVSECTIAITAHVPPGTNAAEMTAAVERCRNVARRAAHFAAKHHYFDLLEGDTTTPLTAPAEGDATPPKVLVHITVSWSIDDDSTKFSAAVIRSAATLPTNQATACVTDASSTLQQSPNTVAPAFVAFALPNTPPWHVLGVPANHWFRSSHDSALNELIGHLRAAVAPRFHVCAAVVKPGAGVVVPAGSAAPDADPTRRHRSVAAPSHLIGCLDMTYVQASSVSLATALGHYAAGSDSLVLVGEAPVVGMADVAEMSPSDLHDRISANDNSVGLMLSDAEKATRRQLALHKKTASDPLQQHHSEAPSAVPSATAAAVSVSTLTLHQPICDAFAKIDPARLAQRRTVVALTSHFLASRSSMWHRMVGAVADRLQWNTAESIVHSAQPPDMLIVLP